jgi:hypothetical protein
VRVTPARTIWQILAELELISHGKTSTWNPSGRSPNADRDPRPQGETNPPHIHYRLEYQAQWTDHGQAQWTDHGREQVRQNAEKELREITHSRARAVPEEPAIVRNARIAAYESQGWTWQDIANAENSTPTEVKKAAAAHRATVDPKGRDESVREYAMRNGMSRSRVQRMFGRAA